MNIPHNRKYLYNIKVVNEMLREGYTINQIAQKNKWSYSGLHQWLQRHYEKYIQYI